MANKTLAKFIDRHFSSILRIVAFAVAWFGDRLDNADRDRVTPTRRNIVSVVALIEFVRPRNTNSDGERHGGCSSEATKRDDRR